MSQSRHHRSRHRRATYSAARSEFAMLLGGGTTLVVLPVLDVAIALCTAGASVWPVAILGTAGGTAIACAVAAICPAPHRRPGLGFPKTSDSAGVMPPATPSRPELPAVGSAVAITSPQIETHAPVGIATGTQRTEIRSCATSLPRC
jgi:hypothetical protein